MNMREEFEKWVLSDYNLCGSDRAFLDKDISGEYVWSAIRIAWKLWQAAQPKWIKCSERLPDVEGKYLTDGTYGVGTSFFTPSWSNVFQDCASNNDEGMEDFEGRVFRVTHWMPLPNPPEE